MKLFLVLASLFTLSITTSAQKKTECIVSGTVLDRSNRTVAKAEVILDAPSTTWEDLVATNTTDEKGNFSYSTSCKFPPAGLTLYVSSPISYDIYVPILSPFRTKELGNSFAGKPITNPKRLDLNLGNVFVQVYYATVILRFVDELGEPLIKDTDQWKDILIRFRSGKKLAAENIISKRDIKKAFRPERSEIAMSLPEGAWTIELSFDGKKWLNPDRILNIQKTETETHETLKMTSVKATR